MILFESKLSALPPTLLSVLSAFISVSNLVLFLLYFLLYSLLVVLEEAYGPPSQSAKKTDFRKLVKDLSRVRRLLQQVS